MLSSDEENKPEVASIIINPKRARVEDPANELARAIGLLEDAEQLERQAKHMREEAGRIKQRYNNY